MVFKIGFRFVQRVVTVNVFGGRQCAGSREIALALLGGRGVSFHVVIFFIPFNNTGFRIIVIGIQKILEIIIGRIGQCFIISLRFRNSTGQYNLSGKRIFLHLYLIRQAQHPVFRGDRDQNQKH